MRTTWFLRAALSVALVGAAGGIVGCGDSGTDMTPAPADLSMQTGDMAKPLPDLSDPGDAEVQEDMESPIEDMGLPGDDAAADDMAVGEDAAVSEDGGGGADGGGGGDDGGGPKPCDNTQQSCGMPGACADCTNSLAGKSCVNNTCGCNSAADCPKGAACDLNKKVCVDTCSDNAPCNGGCCNAGRCEDGNANGACGSDGKACKGCAAGTPTCQAGACTDACVAGKVGDPGVCGQGFCCSAANKCAAIGDGACAAAGATCADCAKSAAGPKCLMTGTCGCATAADCAKGQACKAGVCGTACDMATPCNGGCCSAAMNGTCQAGSDGKACALGGAVCGTCVGNAKGGACVSVNNVTSCGCNTQADCPVGLACDRATKQCTNKCDANNACNGGCCSAAMNGTCQKGDQNAGCGNNGGVCANCTTGMAGGKVCIAGGNGGICGCRVLGDCPITATACTMGVCDTKCDANKPCQFGCCSITQGQASGTCVNGTAAGACGKAGLCVDCAKSANGNTCQPNQVCGCAKTADCPVGLACNLTTKLCENKCSAQQACNGGCCANGTCAKGDAGNACGVNGLVCLDCSTSRTGRACLAGVCGCTKSSECGALQACDVQRKVCTDVCNANQLCNGGCCQAGRCVDGTANSACGGTGGACAACVNAKPTCEKGVCTAKCGSPGNGICGGGNCCKAGACVPGNAQTSCGYSGACIDCATQSTGTRCIAPNGQQNWFCGCEARTDCFGAKPLAGVPGYACDTANKNCTSLCGVAGVSQCNGGCCSGPNGQCRAGNADGACGINGGYCNNCGNQCNPGPKCNPNTGACGCSLPGVYPSANGGDCFTVACLTAGQNIGCNTGAGRCCTTGTPGANKDNGAAANCCTGASMNGACTCLTAGQNTGNPAVPAKCCSYDIDGGGNCRCKPNGTSAVQFYYNGTAFPDARACCSGRMNNSMNCTCSAKGQTAQTAAGCCANLTFANGVCN